MRSGGAWSGEARLGKAWAASAAIHNWVVISDMIQVPIRAGESLSDPASISGLGVCGCVFPEHWTTACLTFEVRINGREQWYQVYIDEGRELRVYGSPGCPSYWPIRIVADEIRVRSGTLAHPVAQADDRIVILLAR